MLVFFFIIQSFPQMFVVGKFFFSFGEAAKKKIVGKKIVHYTNLLWCDDDDIVLVSF